MEATWYCFTDRRSTLIDRRRAHVPTCLGALFASPPTKIRAHTRVIRGMGLYGINAWPKLLAKPPSIRKAGRICFFVFAFEFRDR